MRWRRSKLPWLRCASNGADNEDHAASFLGAHWCQRALQTYAAKFPGLIPRTVNRVRVSISTLSLETALFSRVLQATRAQSY